MANTAVLNGWSNAEKVGNKIVMGSFIDANFAVCDYPEEGSDALKWKKMGAPVTPAPYVLTALVLIALDVALCVFGWRKLSGSDGYSQSD